MKMVEPSFLLFLIGCQSLVIQADLQAHNIREDIEIGTPILRVNASDVDITYSVSNDNFAVDSDGVISNNKRLDADGNNGYYEFLVTMTVAVRIYTKNMNDEEPTFSQQVYTTNVDANAGPNTLVTAVLATDKDGDGVTYGFLGGTNTSGLFRIDPTTGVIRLIDSQINLDLDKYELNVTATDDGKCCVESGAPVDPKDVHTSTALVVVSKVQVLDNNDNSPYFEKSLYEAEVDENEDIGHTVLTLNAIDKDESSRLRYEVTRGNFGGAFSVGKTTGAISVTGPIDYETHRKFELQLVARDGLHENHTTVVIHINNVNDNPPLFDEYIYEVDISEEDVENLTKKILKVTATDGDRDRPENIVYFLAGNSDMFDANMTTGEIFMLKPVDGEEAKRKHQWKFTVYAQDEGGIGLVGYTDVLVNLI